MNETIPVFLPLQQTCFAGRAQAADHGALPGQMQRLKDARLGLHNNRTTYLWEFREQYWRWPEFFDRFPRESWEQARNRIVPKIRGLGYAKTSFAFELLYPTEAEVVCLDVHMLRLYGKERLNGGKGVVEYHRLERDWQERCRGIPAASYVTRCVLWDQWQNKPDSRYWSHCLEAHS